MSTIIGLSIGGRKFDVDVEEKFAVFLEAQMGKDFDIEGNNDVKSVMHAYVRKNYELFKQEEKMNTLLKKLEA